MHLQKPTVLYYDNGNIMKKTALETSLAPLGIALVSISPLETLQTVGYLAKVKGFPAKKLSPLELSADISDEVMVMCNFSETLLDILLSAMRNGLVPRVSLKAMLTPQNSFWTFLELFRELQEEHQHFYGKNK